MPSTEAHSSHRCSNAVVTIDIGEELDLKAILPEHGMGESRADTYLAIRSCQGSPTFVGTIDDLQNFGTELWLCVTNWLIRNDKSDWIGPELPAVLPEREHDDSRADKP